MALFMEKWNQGTSSWDTVDVAGEGLGRFVLTIAYSTPRVLRFVAHQASHTTPLPLLTGIRFWTDDTGGGSDTSPLFEGYVWEALPGANEPALVNYTCYDITHRVAREVPIMSLAWQEGPPVDYGVGAIPRFVCNVTQDSDDDYSYTRGNGLTVGNIIATLLEDALPILKVMFAAPASGDPYESTELDTFTVEPQSKVVFESQRLRQGIDAMLRYYPACRWLFWPGEDHRQWRFNNVTASSDKTLTLNQSAADGAVLSLELHRSLDNRYTAVWIVGPPTITPNTYATGDSSLTETGAEYMGLVDGLPYYAPYSWQITSSGNRQGARRFLADQYVPMGQYNWVRTRSPSLQLSFDGGTTWLSILNPLINFNTGEVSTGLPIYYYVDPPPNPGSDQQIFAPTDVRLLWANYTTPLNIRVPAFGAGAGGGDYEGTAYTDFGLGATDMIYDEMLAVGYEWGQPVTSVTRLAKYAALAQARLDERKNTIVTGGAVLSSLDYDFKNLDMKVNIAAVDADGATLTTGWEDIGAIVTDCEYDFTEKTTTLTFSSDLMELAGMEPEEMKRRLKIRATRLVSEYFMELLFTKMDMSFGRPLTVISGARGSVNSYYVDAESGERA